MKAVIFKGPHKVAIEDRPIPQIQHGLDIIVKVEYTALCGSELHVFRGHQPSPTGFIMGHEFTGRVHEVSLHTITHSSPSLQPRIHKSTLGQPISHTLSLHRSVQTSNPSRKAT